MHLNAFAILSTKSVPHILEKIFFSLDYTSFKICMEVSNSWKELLTSESFKTLGKSVFCKDIERELHQASVDGNLKDVKGILSSGMADVDCVGGPHNATILGYASWKGHRDVVQLLLDKGANPNKATRTGATSLHWAAHSGHKNVVQLLLERGADPNLASISGWTPLHAVCTGLCKKMSARLRELATELGASSHNLADVFLDVPVF